VRAIHDFAQNGFAPLQAAFNGRDALAGLDVALSSGTVGVAQGVDHTGALTVQTADGLKRVTGAEVSVRPVCFRPT
jgi:BirA family biotin operon repressor/biotin-[acetyl-CoA-carboxylase] ligase